MRHALHHSVHSHRADYYGYRDEDDGVIVSLEAEAEAAGACVMRALPWYSAWFGYTAVEEAVREWQQLKASGAIAAPAFDLSFYEPRMDEAEVHHTHVTTHPHHHTCRTRTSRRS